MNEPSRSTLGAMPQWLTQDYQVDSPTDSLSHSTPQTGRSNPASLSDSSGLPSPPAIQPLPPPHPMLRHDSEPLSLPAAGASLARQLDTAASFTGSESAMEIQQRMQEHKYGMNIEAADSLNHMAVALHLHRRYPAALTIYEESLAIKRALYGPLHPSVALTLYNMADVYFQQNQFDKAKTLLQQSYKIYHSIHGPLHADTKMVKQKLETVEKTEKDAQKWDCAIL